MGSSIVLKRAMVLPEGHSLDGTAPLRKCWYLRCPGALEVEGCA